MPPPPRRARLSTYNLLTTTSCTSFSVDNYVEGWLETSIARTNSGKKRKRASSEPLGGEEFRGESEVEGVGRKRRRSVGDFRGTMTGGNQGTSGSSKKHGNEKQPQTPDQGAPKAVSTPTASTTSHVPTHPNVTGRRMDAHGLFKKMNKFNEYPDFKAEVMKIVEGERFSRMKAKSVDLFERTHKKYIDKNENTLLNNLIPLILKSKRKVKADPKTFGEAMDDVSDTHEGDLVKGEVYSALWFDDGVMVLSDQNLIGDLLPDVYNDNDLNKELEKKGDEMKTPRPDRIYGLDPELFEMPLPLLLDRYVESTLEVCPSMYFTYFLIEGKSNDGNALVAENQARRGGATIVNGMRCVYAFIEQPRNELGPDWKTFIFSGTMNINTFDIWVHWALVKSPTVTEYHMDLVHSFALRQYQELPNLRKILHNIMGWGCDLKGRGLDKLHQDIIQWQKKQRHWGEEGKGKDRSEGSNKSTPEKPDPKRHKTDEKASQHH
ncbi:hypothetical protein ACLMJK_005623 [Lecanora helva]